MRLNCPNCGAQYEVPDDVIPEGGRDVQCSSCGNTWFQQHADAEAEQDRDPVRASAMPEPQLQSAPDPEVAKPQDAPVPAPSAPEPEPESESGPETEPEPAAGPAPEPAPVPPPKPRQLDPEVTSVLREEAEREARQREAERGAVESQPDLGLDDMNDDSDLRARQSRERMARLRGKDPDAPDVAAAAAAASGSRRELLPDIEEINSTLRSSDQPRHSEASEEIAAEPERRQRSGFRRGFITVLAVFAVAVAVYIFADSLAEAVPATADFMAAYVRWVDDLRALVDAQVLALLNWLDGLSSETGAAGG